MKDISLIDETRQPSSASWEERLDAAPTAEAVVELARDFAALLTPEELAELPAECRPGKIVDKDDVHALAIGLMQRSCAGDRLTDDLLHRLAAFFTQAAARIALVEAQVSDAHEALASPR